MNRPYQNTLFLFLCFLALDINTAYAKDNIHSNNTNAVRYGTENVSGLDIFYREAGNPEKPS